MTKILENRQKITFTAIGLGLLLSVVMGAANVYLGLKAGMTVSASIPAAVIAMGVLRGILRRRSIPRRALLAGLAGFAGMLLETVLILNYQTNRGVLYQDLGLLLMLFMAGLALGAAAVNAWVRHPSGDRLGGHGTGALLLGMLAGLGALVAAAIHRGMVRGLPGTAVLLGCVLLIYDRLEDSDRAGTSTYFDWSFVLTLLIVTFTGFVTEFMHYLRLEPHRHIVYFIHLVFVFSLLIYLPYSKFAHIIYRTTAMVYAEYTGREWGGTVSPDATGEEADVRTEEKAQI